MTQRFILTAVVHTLIACPLTAQGPQSKPLADAGTSIKKTVRPADLWSSRLTQELVDDFQMDNRKKYTLQNKVEWRPGELRIGLGSSMTLPVFGGPEAGIQLSLAEASATAAGLDLGIAVLPDGHEGCTIEIQRQSAQLPGTCTVRLVEYRQIDGRIASRNVREVEFEAPESINSVAVHYRYGVVSMAMNVELRMVSYVDCRAAPVRGLLVGTQEHGLSLSKMEIRHADPVIPLTENEAETLPKLQVGYREMVQLVQQGQLPDALNAAKTLLPKIRPILKKTAPTSLTLLNDIALVHFQAGETHDALKLYQKLLALYLAFRDSFILK